MSEERWQLVVTMAGLDAPHVLTYDSEAIARDKKEAAEKRRDDWIRFAPDADGRRLSVPREHMRGLLLQREQVAPVVPMPKGNGTAATVEGDDPAAEEAPAAEDAGAPKGA